jgi:hypothetical protein
MAALIAAQSDMSLIAPTHLGNQAIELYEMTLGYSYHTLHDPDADYPGWNDKHNELINAMRVDLGEPD